jgi:hypothetical protein
MKRLIILLALALSGAFGCVYSQVRIGGLTAPHAAAILDLNSDNSNDNGTKGLAMPRVALTSTSNAAPLTDHVKGLTVYNTATVADVVQGVYMNDGTQWVLQNEPKWFYMPSFPIDVSKDVTNGQINLWEVYQRQFADVGGAPLIKSDASAPALPVKIYPADKLYYYITGFDTSVFSPAPTISPTGVMTYNVISANVTDSTYLTVVCVVK